MVALQGKTRSSWIKLLMIWPGSKAQARNHLSSTLFGSRWYPPLWTFKTPFHAMASLHCSVPLQSTPQFPQHRSATHLVLLQPSPTTAPEFGVNLVIRGPLRHPMLILKVSVMCVHLGLLFLGQLGLVPRHASVANLGLGRRAWMGAREGLTATGAAAGVAVR